MRDSCAHISRQLVLLIQGRTVAVVTFAIVKLAIVVRRGEEGK